MEKRVLIIRLGAIGDVVETTGLVRALKKQNYNIDYLTGKAPSTLLNDIKDIDNVYLFESKKYIDIYKLGRKLSKNKYDLILNLQPSLRMKFLCFVAASKKVVNYKKSYKFHAVENFFDTGKKAIPELELDKNIYIDIDEELKQKMLSQLEKNKIKICFNTGANSSRQGRKWCIEYWAELAKMILEKYNAQIFVIGAKEDEENVNELINNIPSIKSFAGKTSLPETAALLSCADLVISGDTGPLHIASATGTTCLGLYGCCSVSRSGPYGEKHKTISSEINCSPCDKRTCKYINSDIDDTPCMRNIKPEKVLNLVDMIIKEK
ncbi:MAG: glycosyltransferase family 9 protein [Candidatus Gastranaerophilales bacterium]|nr:glycosyltransferase family 9 protein [Candidatus Gastranaerophilales bacterium]